MNRVLRQAGKTEVSADLFVTEEDVPHLVSAIAESRREADAANMAWRGVVNVRSTEEVKQIEAALRKGEMPPYTALPPGAALPAVNGPYDMISVHAPAGSNLRYVINLPGSLFPREVQTYKDVKAAQLVLFDGTLRLLFSNP